MLQLSWHYYFAGLEANKRDLPAAIKPSYIRLASLDDSISASKLTMLWLQAFDNQPGISISLKELNYDRVINWLDLILKLDNKTQYPLLAAIRFYAEVQDEERQRKMIDFVSARFLEKPNERWASMAHAVYMAKHRLKDIELALACANLLRQYAIADHVPFWAKQMEIFILEDMGELESAMILIGGLLESGELNDAHQRKFLGQRLEEIKQRQSQ
ncbi:MAG: hypothetical protein ACPHLK_11300 [Gammaproteobacteria bacterium]